MSREKSYRSIHISDRDGRDDRRGEDLSPGMDLDSDEGRRSPRLRRFADKVDRRRERDYGGSNRDRGRDRERDRGSNRGHERERDRDRDWEKERDRGERGRDGDRERTRKRERERDSRRSRSPRHDHQWATPDDYDSRKEPRIQGRGRDSSLDRDKSHKRGLDRGDDDIMATEGQRAAIVAEFVDGIAREHDQHVEASSHSSPAVIAPGTPAVVQADEEEMMKKLGIPVGFSTTKGKYVSDANHSAVKLTTKRTPRQYMNRRGGFNRPLPAETNR